jgi:hypothetical protein
LLVIRMVCMLDAASLWTVGRVGGRLVRYANAHPFEQLHGRCHGLLELTLRSGDTTVGFVAAQGKTVGVETTGRLPDPHIATAPLAELSSWRALHLRLRGRIRNVLFAFLQTIISTLLISYNGTVALPLATVWLL